MFRTARSTPILVLCVLSASLLGAGSLLASCDDGDEGAPLTPTPTATGTGGAAGGTANGGAAGSGNTGMYSDFPADPVVEAPLTAATADLFGAEVAGDGPCLAEPPIDAMFPNNWTPPFFKWVPAADQNVFELRLSVENQTNDLVVYTDKSSYTMAATTWSSLALHSLGKDITVTVRGGRLEGSQLAAGPTKGTSGDVHIAPVSAPGSVVYWTTSNNSALKGFSIGAANVTDVITPTLIGDSNACVGCHTSSPDGNLAFFSRGGPPFFVEARSVDGTATAPSEAVVSTVAATMLARENQTLPVFSTAHYSSNDAVVLTELNHPDTNGAWEIVWTDLHAGAGGGAPTGIIARTGDTGSPSTPSWSHDGTLVAYTSSSGDNLDGANVETPTDIYTVPYNDKQGGTASKLSGAAEGTYNEYYPVFSPGDVFIAFNRVPSSVQNMYDEEQAELFVVPASGGSPTRLAANDPPQCTGITSPGITNSWARWAPSYGTLAGKRYYWIIFSSTRGGGGHLQLYVSAVVTTVGDGGTGETLDKTYPAIYVTTQPPNEENHTPAWDVFKIQGPN